MRSKGKVGDKQTHSEMGPDIDTQIIFQFSGLLQMEKSGSRLPVHLCKSEMYFILNVSFAFSCVSILHVPEPEAEK